MNINFRSLVLASAVALAACGGSGGPSNKPPQFSGTTFAVDEDTTLVETIAASDADGDSVSLAITANAGHGTVSLDQDRTFTYVPAANFSGVDTFDVTATDSRGAQTRATITITVRAVNDPPSAQGDSTRTPPGRFIDVPVLANDINVDQDVLVPEIVGTNAGGSVAVNADGTIRFTPDAGFVGVSSFDYLVRDAAGAASNSASVTVEVRPLQKVAYVGKAAGELFVTYVDLDSTRVLETASAGAGVAYLGLSANGRTLVYGIARSLTDQSWSYVEMQGAFEPRSLTVPAQGVGQGLIKINRDGTALLAGESVIAGGQATTRIHLIEPYAGTDRVLNTAPPSPEQSWDFRFIDGDSKALYVSHAPSINGQNARLFAADTTQVSAPVQLRPTLANGDSFASIQTSYDGRYIVYSSDRSSRGGAYSLDLQSPGNDTLLGPQSSPSPCNPCLAGIAVSPIGAFAAYTLDAVPPASSSGYLINLATGQRFDIGPGFASGTRVRAPLFSPDGQHVLLFVADAASSAFFEVDVSNPGVLRQMSPTFPATTAIATVQYTPDGRNIVYTSYGSTAVRNLYVTDRSRAPNATQLNEDLGTDVSFSFVLSPDGSTVAYTQAPASGPGQPNGLYLIDLSTPGQPLLVAPDVVIALANGAQPYHIVP